MQNKILFYIEQPPPMHGMTYINKIIYDNLKDKNGYCFYNTNFNVNVNESGKISLKKILKNISIIFGAWRVFFKQKPNTIYTILSATKFGIIRDIMINFPVILLKKKLILHLHGFTYYKIYQTNKLYRLLFNIISKNSKLIVLCENQKKITLDIMGEKSVILNNCINENNIKIKKQNKMLQLCYISNISKNKGTLDLIKALQDSRKDFRLVIAGNFLDNKKEFFNLIKNSHNIKYIGFADEKIKQNLLESSDIFCLPSKLEEGSPISIIEAMSYGLPILSSDKGCIKEMIENNGFLLNEKYKYEDILHGLEFIENNYEQLSKKSLENYLKNYSKNNFIKKIDKLIMEELENV